MGTRMRTGLTISAIGHLALLVWCFVTLPSTKIESTEAIPVDVVSDTELSQIMAGVKTAPKADAPKPVVDKVAPENKPVKDPTPKVSDKPEIQATSDTPPKPPEPKPPDPKPAQAEAKPPEPPPAQAEAKPETKPETKPDKPVPQVDPIAEALKRDEAKKKEEARKLAEAKKKEEAKKREEAKREEAKKREQEKYDPSTIENRLALLDKRAPQRQASLGATLNQTASLGAPTATGPSLSVNELAALQARLADCWDVPVGVRNARDLSVIVRIQFRRDGSLETDPVVVNRSALPVFQVAAESAVRAVRKCAPFSFMPVAKYEAWKELEVNFDPKQMFGL
jgi:hypothetical protein